MNRTIGIGAITKAKKPSRDEAHCVPSFSYICDADPVSFLTPHEVGLGDIPNKGKPAPNADRTTAVRVSLGGHVPGRGGEIDLLIPARAEAADQRYVSIT